jgi:hypothetical protein
MRRRYQHMTSPVLQQTAAKVGGLLWPAGGQMENSTATQAVGGPDQAAPSAVQVSTDQDQAMALAIAEASIAPGPGGALPSAVRPSTDPVSGHAVVFVANVGQRLVPFWLHEHALALVDRWNMERPGRSAEVEVWDQAKWDREGPGGPRAVRDCEPDQQVVFHAYAAFRPGGERVDLSLPEQWSVAAWDFETDLYTDRSASWRTARRPGSEQLVEAQVRGTDKSAVAAAFVEAVEQAVDRARNPGKFGDTSDW